MRVLLLLTFLVATGCSELNPITIPENFDPKSVTRMAFRISELEKSQLQDFDPAELDGVSREISDRFSEAGYPVINGQKDIDFSRAASESESNSHLLQISVGGVALTQMPVGFTLDFGDSTPRAQNFQKTTTVDIDCRLIDLRNQQLPILISERKAIPARVANAHADLPENFEKVRRYYVENIGATCHDLLDKLDIYPKKPESASGKAETQSGTWGGMRIKTEYEEETAIKVKSPTPDRATPAIPPASLPVIPPVSEKRIETPNAKAEPLPTLPVTEKPKPAVPHTEHKPPSTAAPSKVPEPESVSKLRAAEPAETLPRPVDKVPPNISVDQPSTVPVAMKKTSVPIETHEPEAPESVSPSISTEENKTGDWRKKKMTIFNQGNTVILKFGPDR